MNNDDIDDLFRQIKETPIDSRTSIERKLDTIIAQNNVMISLLAIISKTLSES